MKPMKVEEALGKKLAYDVTLITEDYKGAILRRGHVITLKDVDVLKKSGHHIVFVEDEVDENVVHEDEAVYSLAKQLAGEGIYVERAPEGKAVLKATYDGLFKVNDRVLYEINYQGLYAVISRRTNSPVRKNDVLAVVDLIPLTISVNDFERHLELARKNYPVFMVKKFVRKSVGVVVTGTEVYEGLIEDKASDKVEEKVRKYGGYVAEKNIVPDDEVRIREAILDFIRKYDLVIVTGGMSVDPTDKTPKAIASTGAKIVAYGIPVKPTTMSLIAYYGEKPIIGVSSGIIFFKEENVLDILLPKIMANEKWAREEIASLGHGGIMPTFLKKYGKHKHT